MKKIIIIFSIILLCNQLFSEPTYYIVDLFYLKISYLRKIKKYFNEFRIKIFKYYMLIQKT